MSVSFFLLFWGKCSAAVKWRNQEQPWQREGRRSRVTVSQCPGNRQGSAQAPRPAPVPEFRTAGYCVILENAASLPADTCRSAKATQANDGEFLSLVREMHDIEGTWYDVGDFLPLELFALRRPGGLLEEKLVGVL